MQKSKILLTLAIAASSSLISCKKDGASTHDKLVAKWTVTSVDAHQVISGQSETLTETPPAGSYIQFNSDGTYTSHSDDDETGTWSLSGNTVTVISDQDTTTADIKKLDGSSLDLYSKQTDGADYAESTVHCKK